MTERATDTQRCTTYIPSRPRAYPLMRRRGTKQQPLKNIIMKHFLLSAVAVVLLIVAGCYFSHRLMFGWSIACSFAVFVPLIYMGIQMDKAEREE